MLFHALSMLCGLGTATFATSATGWRTASGLTLGFAAAAVLIRPERLPNPVWTGGLVALAAILQLVRPGVRPLTAASGGALAGLWSSILRMQGLPPAPALILAAALPAISAILTARRPAFAPVTLREEALVVVLLLGLAVAMAPEVSAGWRSALALNLEEKNSVGQIVPAWVLFLSAVSAALGGLYSLWTRR